MSLQFTITDYQQFLINTLNHNFLSAEHQIEWNDISEPLTGKRIRMDDVDMLALFVLLEEHVQQPLYIDNIYTFWNIEFLAAYLQSLDDEKLKKYMQEGRVGE